MRFCFFAFRFVLIGLLVASSGICFGQFAVSDNAVLRAAATGNADVLKSLMASGGRADAMTDRGEPAVYLAVQANHVESVKVLLDAGATGLNGLYGKSRFSPLTNAATADNTSMIKLLIDHGASLSLVDGGGLDPLSSAIISKSPEAVRLIADAGGDPNLRLPRGLSAPLRAAIYGDVEIEKIILDHKGNVDARDDAGASALMYAAAMGREGNVRLLLERGAKVYPLNASQRSALGEAKLFEDAEVRERIVAMLKAAGAAENNAQRPIDAQFLKAAYDGNLALVKTLLAKGADIEARGKLDGPLYLYDALSVSVKHPEVTQYLLQQNINPFMTSSAGFTALHTAARDGPRATVDMLLKKGLNPNETTPRGFTPLFMAMNGKINLANVEALLKAGADPNGKSISGESLVEVARRLKNSRLEKLLVDAGATN